MWSAIKIDQSGRVHTSYLVLILETERHGTRDKQRQALGMSIDSNSIVHIRDQLLEMLI